DYARAETRTETRPGGIAFVAEGQPSLRLSATVVMTREPGSAVAQFTLQAGEHAEFVFGNDDDPQVQHIATERCFRDTVDYWRRWSS
ncbi:hypothetical protein QM259_19685, partial [Acinetobacter baumannii]|uniref:hypothetical protein n=1 Tax=Acinetobacter baumannii TaxID=470 RepID=UPI0024B77381